MKRTILIIAIALLIAAVPAVAGSECSSDDKAASAKKCTAETQDCLNYMVQKFQTRGWVGIELDSHHGEALTVTKVEPDSPAEAAGLEEGDVLVALNGIRFSEENEEAMKGAQAKMTIGATVTYTVQRSGRSMDLDVKLAAIPDAVMAKWIGRHMLDHASITIAEN